MPKGNCIPAKVIVLTANQKQYEVAVVVKGKWANEDIDHFEFVSEFKLSEKLDVTGTTYGLGVPLIAVRRKQSNDDPREKYYPKDLVFQ